MKKQKRSTTAQDWSGSTAAKRAWSTTEDQRLRSLVREHGTTQWTLVSERLGCRTGKQCRERWHNHLDPSVVKGGWSQEEDALIVRLQSELGNQWAVITKQLPGRTDNAVKNRWHSTMRSKGRKMTASISAHALPMQPGAKNSTLSNENFPKIYGGGGGGGGGPAELSTLRVLSPINSILSLSSPTGSATATPRDGCFSPFVFDSSDWASVLSIDAEGLKADPVLAPHSPRLALPGPQSEGTGPRAAAPHFAPVALTPALTGGKPAAGDVPISLKRARSYEVLEGSY